MRIGVNARTFSVSQPGGEGQASMKLISELVNISNNDFEFIIFGHKNIKSKFSNKNVNVVNKMYFINSQLYGLIYEQTALNYLVRKYNIEILLCPSANGFLLKLDNKVKTLVWIHDVDSLYKFVRKEYRYYSKLRYPLVSRSAYKIITVSNFSRDEIHKLVKVPLSKIEVIYNGIDPFFLSDAKGEKVENLPEKYILFVGSAIPRKNLRGLITAYELIKDKINESLVIVGPWKKSLYKLMFGDIKLKNFDRIKILGFIKQSELKYIYENASLFVFPSLYEGFGLPPLEAMACGTPVVASNVSALPEILGDAAHYVNPYDIEDIAKGILKVLNDDSYRKELIKKGKKQAKKYTWEKAATKLKTLIEEIAR